MQCPKCHYVRRESDTAPDWECPACGVAYAKVGTEPHLSHPKQGGSPYLVSGFFLVVFAMLGYGVFSAATRSPSGQHLRSPVPAVALAGAMRSERKAVAARPVREAAVIMYSLSDCGYCVQKRKELNAAGIPFVEYFIDFDPVRDREWNDKVMSLGFANGTFIGTPTFDVNGTILPNNPSLDEIRRHL